MNAYELADALKNDWADKFRFDAANMLRQQADRIAELEKPHKYDTETGEPLIDGYPLFSGLPKPQTKPLSDEEIIKIFNQIWNAGGNTNGVMHRFARAIEERHGIK